MATDAGSEFTEGFGLFRLDDQKKACLREFRSYFEKHGDDIIGRFYEFVVSQPGASTFFDSGPSLESIKAAQKAHWLRIFSCQFDETFMQTSQVIGAAHMRKGVTPIWYVGGYSYMLSMLCEQADSLYKTSVRKRRLLRDAIQSVAMVDMQAALSAYIGSVTDVASTSAVGQFSQEIMDATVELSMKVNEATIHGAEMMTNLGIICDRAQQMSSAVEQMSAGMQSISENSRSASENATQAREASAVGRQIVAEATEGMKQIAVAVSQSSEQISRLSVASQQIGEIVSSIDEIASRTNLLALNATIEAARAGEAGKGFAVVASEVKNLSNQTARATEDIRRRIQDLQDNTKLIVDSMLEATRAVEEGQSVVGQVSDQIGAIDEQNMQVSARMEEISGVLSEHTQASTEVANHVSGIASQTQEDLLRIENGTQTLDNAAKLIDSQLAQLMNYDIPNKIVRVAKADHVMWKKRLADMFSGRLNLRSEELSDHRSCRLGKWYYGPDAERYRRHPAFRDLEPCHKAVHAHGIRSVQLFNEGQREAALEELYRVDNASVDVIKHLNTLAQDDQGSGDRKKVKAVG
ncbi:MAG: CZB domain-containing protein [Rhodospirillales bacterium]|nr:CZB domain-containing protein [Rhodospirillales bacterium]